MEKISIHKTLTNTDQIVTDLIGSHNSHNYSILIPIIMENTTFTAK